MKKYLMTGVAAIAICAAFTSCSKSGDDLYNPEQIQQNEIAQVYENYNRAFIQTFGQPAANQDWGFGTGARTRAENANANEWADVKNSTGFGGWKVPDALTEGQKLRVKAYFQANPKLTFNDPHLENFFVQQVYKGNTSGQVGANSTEVVTAADGSTYTSNNMNLLTVGQAEIHINNFNNGTATTLSVLDNGSDILAGKKSYHNDEIMLMVDITDTSCFGYHETGSSNEPNPNGAVNHNDRAALVAASVIDQWAKDYGNNIGEAVTDKWNRSFLGFDLAIKEGDAIFSGDIQNFDEGLNMGYDGVYFDDDNIVRKVDVDPTHAPDDAHPWGNYDKTWPTDFENVMKDANNNPLKILSSNTNFYSGEKKTIDDSFLRKDDNGVLLNMKKVNEELISKGYYPVSGSAFKTWIKPTASYDGYFSDWIVTLTKAERVPTPSIYVDRIIAEDLNAKAITSEAAKDGLEESDWDFNDVVFDVRYADGNAYVLIRVVGGVLPLYVGGQEVHELYGQTVGADGLYKIIGAKDAPQELVLSGISSSNRGKDIPITIMKTLSNGGQQIFELKAEMGTPAAKIRVDPDKFTPCSEREDIRTRYPNFSKWVLDPHNPWYYTVPSAR